MGSGMSVMEMSHRSVAFEAIIGQSEADLRELLQVPSHYKVLFLQGGASLQFSMIPLNFLGPKTSADYVVTGSWGVKAVEAGRIEGRVNVVYDGKAGGYRDVPKFDNLALSDDAEYVHFTSNETIQGVAFKEDPHVAAPLICDMSSDILSRPVEVGKYGLIYAGAQKNLGPAGLTIVIIREDLLEQVAPNLHPMLDYRLQAQNNSLYNTPPCWSIYVSGLVLKYLKANGGLQTSFEKNRAKAELIYKTVDQSEGFYIGHAAQEARSLMNVTFTLASEDLTKKFVQEAEALGLDGLKGHRSVGGIRASIYNAFPHEGAVALSEFMDQFAKNNG